MHRILIAEDEPRITAFLQKGLTANGFSTSTAEDGQEVLEQIHSSKFDLLILDLGLPVKDGWAVLEEVRGQGEQLPIIILTAHNDIQDKVAGLEGGANDYITKPFRFEELLARVRVQLRDNPLSKGNGKEEKTTLQWGSLALDLRTRQARIGTEQVELSAREFNLLETFLRHPGQVLSREQLLDHVWGYNYDPGSNIVDVYVGYLRKKLGGKLIETVRGMGYRLQG